MILPNWAPFLRPTQTIAIQDILQQFQSSPIVFLEAPTGSGKTLIAECIRQELSARGLYLCSSISLQYQFAKDFPYAAILKGRSNYPTLDKPELYKPSKFNESLSCADCTKKKTSGQWQCSWCHPVAECPYEQAKATALRSDLVCANSYYFLYEANFVGTLSSRDLVVIDECDTLESVLLSFIQVEISARRMKEFGLPYPGKKTVMSSWIDWAEECKGIVDEKVRIGPETLFPDLALIKRTKRLENLQSDLNRLMNPQFGLKTENWVYTGYKENDVIFKPVTVAPYGKDYLWKHGKKFLLMSATIISTTELAESLGLSQ